MSALIYRLLLVASVVAAFVWLQVPELNRYSGQVFALVLVIYFVLKRVSNAKLWHLAPNVLSTEMPLVTFAVLILIGSTGNLHSLYYPVSYIHLFFLVFATDVATTLMILVLIMLFHYGLAPAFTPEEISFLSSLPVITFFFMFAKAQYLQAKTERHMLQTQQQELLTAHSIEASLHSFLVQVVQPKLENIQQLMTYPEHNRTALKGQLTWLQLQIEKVISQTPPIGQSPMTLPTDQGSSPESEAPPVS